MTDGELLEKLKNLIKEEIRPVKEQQSIMNEKLDQHTESLVQIETTVKSYSDMYKMNDDNVRKIQKRVEKLEKKSGIEPSPELILVDIQ